MQKKKPSFQVIPNYRINGAPNWNESKKCLRNKGCNDRARATSPTAAGSTCTVIAAQNDRADIAIRTELAQPSRQNGATQ
jgi:hypothetical protein